MFSAPAAPGSGSTLMGEYASLLADAALRQRAREAEHTARVEAELARKIESELLARMSQELRAPLGTVIGFAKLLAECERRHLSKDQVAAYADLIQAAAMRLQAVIDNAGDVDNAKSLGAGMTSPAKAGGSAPHNTAGFKRD